MGQPSWILHRFFAKPKSLGFFRHQNVRNTSYSAKYVAFYVSVLCDVPKPNHLLFFVDQNTRRESGRKVQLGNVEAAKVPLLFEQSGI